MAAGCMLVMRQLLLLTWKNFILQIRRPIGTAFELILPSIALITIVGLRQIPGASDLFRTCPVSYSSIPLDGDDLEFSTPNVLAYYPSNSTTDAIMARVAQRLTRPDLEIIPAPDYNDGNPFAFLVNNVSKYAGVQFDRLDRQGRAVEYTLRFPYEDGFSTGQTTDDFSSNFVRQQNTYIYGGFTVVQKALEESIIEYFINSTGQTLPDISLYMRPLPFPPTATDFYLVFLSFFLGTLIIISFMYTAATITKELVIEKETRIRESMLMMGLRQWVLWASWFIKQFLFMFIWVIAYTLLFKYANVWPKSDGFLIFIFFLLYIITIIAYGFFMSVWFNSPLLALFVSFAVFFITYLPTYALAVQRAYDAIPYHGKLALGLLPNTAFTLGLTVISNLEGQELGLQWNNLGDELSIADDLRMDGVFGMLICDIILYFLIAWYVNAVRPGTYGVPKPFYFPFLPSYWLGRPLECKRGNLEEEPSEERQDWYDPKSHEGEPTEREAGIRIYNISKTYVPGILSLVTEPKLAVDGLSLNMFEGHITALLGHNGAGKTTTISILTGLYTPTSGTAVINGYDIRTNMDQIRHSLGICPQHNVLFDRLTVREHLRLFAILKGMPFNMVNADVDRMLKDLQFEDKKKTIVSTLSGGMKRKLSVSIALIGGSKTVVLDEPTSGMDPYARRATWDLLAKHKEGRTILLTTHFMDEADLLGDRIAIMAEGRLMCSGSSLFLKSRYGVGYHLTLVKTGSCNTDQLTQLITSTVPGSQLASNVSAELTFLLPFTSSQHFPTLLDTLENERERLGVASYGVSQTSMEEVFLKVGTGSNDFFIGGGDGPRSAQAELSKEREEVPVTIATSETGGNTIELLEVEGGEFVAGSSSTTTLKRNTGPILWLQQFWALFLKRVLNSVRFYVSVITQLIVPLFFIIGALALTKIPGTTSEDDPRRVLTLQESSLSRTAQAFYAHFGDNIPAAFSFNNIEASNIRATSLVNLKPKVEKIISEVSNRTISDPSDCCEYELQILDKYCASQIVRELRKCKGDFAYRHCEDCLICESRGFRECPASPFLSSLEDPQPMQPLNERNHFIAEHFLREAREDERSVFFRRAQACYVFAVNEPTEGVCASTNNFYGNSSNPDYGSFSIPDYDFDDGINGTVIGGSVSRFYDTPERLTATIWFNNQALHTVGAALNVYYNVLLKNLMNNTEWTITAYNHPLPQLPQTTANEELIVSIVFGQIITIIASFGFAFFISTFVVFPITERETKAKHLQFVSGANPIIYWMANYAWDLINAAVIVLITFIIIIIFQTDGYSGDYLGFLFILLVFTCFSSIPFAYVFSFLFNRSVIAYAIFFIIYYIPALVLQITVGFLPEFTEKQRVEKDLVHYFSLLHPGYGFQIGLRSIYIAGGLSSFCSQGNNTQISECDPYLENMFEFDYPGIGAVLLYMAIESVAFLGIVLLIEYSFFIPLMKRLYYYMRSSNQNEVIPQSDDRDDLDPDVAEEARRVTRETVATDDNVVVIKNLTKVYSPYVTGCSLIPKKRAVDNLCLAIPRGEFFGFAGVNGAGKTSTFSMLTGERLPSEGTAYIAGYDIRTDIKKVQQQIGYCPQFDALIERMTGRELLTMFARLRGIPESHIRGAVTATIIKLDLTKYASVQCGKYSGGNKRKLSTAIALIGDPPILFLDEPTTGMDPGTRRYLWDVLTGVTREGRSIILTTHSMEECEALCTRLTIMVNGEFRCLGSIQHLKSKFSDGYTLQVKVNLEQLPLTTAASDPAPPPPPNTAPGGDSAPDQTLASDSVAPSDAAAATTTQQSAANTPDEPGSEKPQELPSSAQPPSYTPTASGYTPGSPLPSSPMSPYPPTYSELFTIPTPGSERLIHNVKVFIELSFQGSVLTEEHQGSVTYQLPSAGLTWSSVFRQLEANKERLSIVDYSVSQTTLDQVFVNFAKAQEGAIL